MQEPGFQRLRNGRFVNYSAIELPRIPACYPKKPHFKIIKEIIMDLKKTPYWNIYADIFNYFKAFIPVQQTEEYWDEVVSEGEKLFQKYQHTKQEEFVCDEIISIQKELQRLSFGDSIFD